MNARLRLPLVILAILLLSGCAVLGDRYESPELTLIDIRPVESGNLEQRFALRFRLLNPNGVSLPVRGMRYRVDLLGETFATGATPDDIDVPAFSETEVDVTVSVSLLRAARVALAAIERGPEELDYRLDARIVTPVPFLGDVRVVHEGVVPLVGDPSLLRGDLTL